MGGQDEKYESKNCIDWATRCTSNPCPSGYDCYRSEITAATLGLQAKRCATAFIKQDAEQLCAKR